MSNKTLRLYQAHWIRCFLSRSGGDPCNTKDDRPDPTARNISQRTNERTTNECVTLTKFSCALFCWSSLRGDITKGVIVSFIRAKGYAEEDLRVFSDAYLQAPVGHSVPSGYLRGMICSTGY